MRTLVEDTTGLTVIITLSKLTSLTSPVAPFIFFFFFSSSIQNQFNAKSVGFVLSAVFNAMSCPAAPGIRRASPAGRPGVPALIDTP